MRRPFSAPRRLVLCLLPGIFALSPGCLSPPIDDPARTGPYYQPGNVSHDPTLGGIRRVVVMPVWGGSAAPEDSAADLDPVFRQALQDQRRFEIVTFSRAECRRRFGSAALSSAAALPRDFIATMQRLYAADAVLFVDLTVYRAYHPLALGIRARLAAVNSLRLVWTVDELFSATDPRVIAGARHFYLESEHQGVPGDLTPAVLQSPGRFAAYAAATTFSTLPPVTLGRSGQTSGGWR